MSANAASATDAQGDQIAVVVNGERCLTRAATIAALVADCGYGEAKIATALNGSFVPAKSRAATPLSDGDHVEIVAPRQGG